MFVLIGFFVLWRAAVREFRRLNADDPEEQRREAERVRKRARKAFTDEEIEDESLDGYVPLSRWMGPAGPAIEPGAAPKPALTGTPIPFDASDEDDQQEPIEEHPSQHGHVLVLGASGSRSDEDEHAETDSRATDAPESAESAATSQNAGPDQADERR
jgi:hypothetical protein